MRIRWTPAAAADLEAINDFLAARLPHFRQPTIRKLYERIRSLKSAPFVGRPGTVDGTRELLFPPTPYIAVYRVNGQTIEIWRLYHASQSRSTRTEDTETA
jgi:toxin ParE1/3/4